MKLAVEVLKLAATVGLFVIVMPVLLVARWALVGLAWICGARR